MNSILFISFIDVSNFTGNHQREQQLLRYFNGKGSLIYFNINSPRDKVEGYLKNNQIQIEQLRISSLFHYITVQLFKLNYLLNYILCTKLKIYKNYIIFFQPLFLNFSSYSHIICFYSIPFHFLNLKNNSKSLIYIDTNDIMLDRHYRINSKVWWSFSKKYESKLNSENIRLLFISENDRDFYEKEFNCLGDVLPFSLDNSFVENNSYFEKIYDIGFIGSSNVFNKDSAIFLINYIKSVSKINLLIAGSVNKLLKNIFIPSNVNLFSENSFSKNFLKNYYSSIKFSFLPAQNNSGIKTKILESLSFGVPVITNKLGYDNTLHLFLGKVLFVYDDLSQIPDFLNVDIPREVVREINKNYIILNSKKLEKVFDFLIS